MWGRGGAWQQGDQAREMQAPPLILFSFSSKQRDCPEDHAPEAFEGLPGSGSLELGAWDGLEDSLWTGLGPL